jgi:hypothetical protein
VVMTRNLVSGNRSPTLMGMGVLSLCFIENVSRLG